MSILILIPLMGLAWLSGYLIGAGEWRGRLAQRVRRLRIGLEGKMWAESVEDRPSPTFLGLTAQERKYSPLTKTIYRN